MHYNSTIKKSWQEKAVKIGDKIVRHLSEASTQPDDADAESEESELYDSNAYGAEWGDKSGG